MDNEDGAINDNFSPDWEGELRRVDSDKSWKDSQGDNDPGEENPKINLDKLFLISLGTIMTLFTWVTHKLGLLCNISKDGL